MLIIKKKISRKVQPVKNSLHCLNLLRNDKINIAHQIFYKMQPSRPLSFIAFFSYHLSLLTEYFFVP